MKYLELCLAWFCYGWTFITFPGTILVVLLSLWSDYENTKHQENIRKMMTEDLD